MGPLVCLPLRPTFYSSSQPSLDSPLEIYLPSEYWPMTFTTIFYPQNAHALTHLAVEAFSFLPKCMEGHRLLLQNYFLHDLSYSKIRQECPRHHISGISSLIDRQFS